MASKLDLPPVKNCNVSIRAVSRRTIRSRFQDLVNNKCTLRTLIVTFFYGYLCIIGNIVWKLSNKLQIENHIKNIIFKI